jgi:hypothetical protein
VPKSPLALPTVKYSARTWYDITRFDMYMRRFAPFATEKEEGIPVQSSS